MDQVILFVFQFLKYVCYKSNEFSDLCLNAVKKIEDRNHMVVLKSYQNDEKRLCSATIVSSWKVVTIASCVYKKDSVYLELGSMNLNSSYFRVNVSQENIIVHPEYSSDFPQANNIAVIYLKNQLQFEEKIGKIEMVDKDYKAKPGANIVALGISQHTTYKNIRYVDATIENFKECRYNYWKINKYRLLKQDKQMCINLDDLNVNIARTFSGGSLLYLFYFLFNE